MTAYEKRNFLRQFLEMTSELTLNHDFNWRSDFIAELRYAHISKTLRSPSSFDVYALTC